MTRVAVATLTGRALDWVIAQCEGGRWDADRQQFAWDFLGMKNAFWQAAPQYDDGAGNRIIDKAGIATYRRADGTWMAAPSASFASLDRPTFAGVAWHAGPSRTTAALRCYVAEMRGLEVEIPDEVLHEELHRQAAVELPRVRG